ncbi:MAG: rRNA maturation RNase YbeY [Magnetococcus sp. DMHC-6]
MLATILINQDHPDWPDVEERIRAAVFATLHLLPSDDPSVPVVEVGITLTGDTQIQTYNRCYRGVDRPTNVLSFAMEDETTPLQRVPGEPRLLGDILLSYETITHEATQQGKIFLDHLTHLVVHGVLHLLGFDHERSVQAAFEQESLEIAILAGLGIGDPYA